VQKFIKINEDVPIPRCAITDNLWDHSSLEMCVMCYVLELQNHQKASSVAIKTAVKRKSFLRRV